jgi:hypothetical protein
MAMSGQEPYIFDAHGWMVGRFNVRTINVCSAVLADANTACGAATSPTFPIVSTGVRVRNEWRGRTLWFGLFHCHVFGLAKLTRKASIAQRRASGSIRECSNRELDAI